VPGLPFITNDKAPRPPGGADVAVPEPGGAIRDAGDVPCEAPGARERTGIADVFAEIEGLLHDPGYRLYAQRPDGMLEDVILAALPDNTLGIPVRHEDTSYASGSMPPASS